jgi:hypothetical protein
MWLLSVVVAVSLAACSSPPPAPPPTQTVTVAAPPPAPPPTPPPAPPPAAAPAAGAHSAKADIDLPAGTVPECDPGESKCGGTDPDMEFWVVTTPYAYTVQFIRQQLPIGKDYEGLPWCSQEYKGDFAQWDWSDADTSLVVVVQQTGRVVITHGPHSQGREGCK